MVSPCIIRNITRPQPEVLAELARYGVATVHEAYKQQGLLRADIRPRGHSGPIAGPAVTSLNHAGDNLMIHAAIEVCKPGDVLVVGVTSPCTDGMVGELIATSCRARGIAGVVLDAGVRDVAELRKMDFPVWSRAISAMGTVKSTPGWVNVPIVCGGVTVNPGDAMVADGDGVVVVARSDVDQVLESARARIVREEASRKRYQDGELSLDVNNLRETLKRGGVIYLDNADERVK